MREVAPATGRGGDAQRRWHSSDGETSAVVYAARVACANIVDVIEALWWIINDMERAQCERVCARHSHGVGGNMPSRTLYGRSLFMTVAPAKLSRARL